MAKRLEKRKFRKLSIESLENRRLMATLPFGAEADDTGEFMLGRISVTPVLLESNGSIDASTENWTPFLINSVMSNVQTGLNWWKQLLATKSSVHTLDWIIDRSFVDTPKSTPYEPIARTSNNYSLWVSRFLSDVGYSSGSSLDDNMRAFNDAQRTKNNTDWSFTIFVVNSTNDSDGSFAPGGEFSRAFAFAGGLYMVVPSTRPASTFAHETGHIFWARDEYAGGASYYERRGYYNAQNSNALDLNPTPGFVQQPSIMSSGTALQVAYETVVTADATLAQIGWVDSDNDGIFDLLDVPLKLEGTGRLSTNGLNYRFTGRASAQALPNRNSSGLQNNITLNTVDRIEYRINGGSWVTYASPRTYVADLDLNIPVGANASGTIEIRAIDSDLGITSNVFSGQLGPIPDVTTSTGIHGFVWGDANDNAVWSIDEQGLSGVRVQLIDGTGSLLAMQQFLEPDNLPIGNVNPIQPGVRVDVIGLGTNGSLAVGADGAASTGTKVFKPYAFNGDPLDAFFGNDQQLRARFNTTTSFASIDAIAIADDTDVRLEAFDANNNLVIRTERKGLLAGQKVSLEVGSALSNIQYVVARGFDQSFVKFDNLAFGPRSFTTTASDGSFVFPFVPAGTYNVQVVMPGLGYEPTLPSTGKRSISFGQNGSSTHVDFGVYQAPSPWRNAVRPEDIDGVDNVTPLDVLTLINEINRNGSRSLDGSGLTSPPYYDPDGDRVLGPLDVLMVVNYINRSGVSGRSGGEDTSPEDQNEPDPPVVSFVNDLRIAEPTTRIISSTTTRSLRESSGAEKCGCPSCTSFDSPAGESSPALDDIARASVQLPLAGPLLPSEDRKDIWSLDQLTSDDWLDLL